MMIATQSRGLTIPHMTEHDEALLTATERAREAQEDFRETKPHDPAIVPNAHKVVQRAEEVDELAKDASDTADGGERSASHSANAARFTW